MAFSHLTVVRLFEEASAVQLRFHRLSSSVAAVRSSPTPGWKLIYSFIFTLMNLLVLFSISWDFLRTTPASEKLVGT